MKPIIKKYASKDLNIAYNDGYNEGKSYMRKVNHSDTLNLTNQFNAGYKKGIKESQTVGFALEKELMIKALYSQIQILERKRKYWENKYKQVKK
jgi:hypothetical protein